MSQPMQQVQQAMEWVLSLLSGQRDLQVAMFGGRGVGKTSLLAAMNDRFAFTVGEADLQLRSDLESAARLADRLSELKTMVEHVDTLDREFVQPTIEQSYAYRFGLGQKGKRPKFHVRFVDYPGEWLSENKNPERVLKIVRESDVLLIAIDAAAMMEERGRYHEQRNWPQQICTFFQHGFEELTTPRLVIFAPIKCETYVQDPSQTALLRQKLEESYKPLFELFRSPSLREKVAVVITPVQTVGVIFFSRVVAVDKRVDFVFRKKDGNALYAPRDSEQPLRYLLRFLLQVYLQRSFLSRIGGNEHLVKAMAQFAKGCKEDELFRVVQGQKLLARPGGTTS